MKRFPVLLIALALMSACGVVEDDIAASVDGTEISVDALQKFADTEWVAQQAQLAGGLSSTSPGSLGGATLRIALPFQVQTLIYENEIEALKGEITADDLEQAEQAVASNETNPQTGEPVPIDAAARKELKRYVAAQAALVRLFEADAPSTEVTPERIADYFEANREQYDTLSCVDGFAVPEEAGAAAQERVDAGASVAEVLADPSLQAQGLSATGETECVLPVQVSNTAIVPNIFEAPIGAWTTSTLDNGDGTNAMVFLRPVSRTEATPETEQVVDAISALLANESEQAGQGALAQRFTELLESADVTIDPRFGSWNPKDQTQLIVPPPVPRA